MASWVFENWDETKDSQKGLADCGFKWFLCGPISTPRLHYPPRLSPNILEFQPSLVNGAVRHFTFRFKTNPILVIEAPIREALRWAPSAGVQPKLRLGDSRGNQVGDMPGGKRESVSNHVFRGSGFLAAASSLKGFLAVTKFQLRKEFGVQGSGFRVWANLNQ